MLRLKIYDHNGTYKFKFAALRRHIHALPVITSASSCISKQLVGHLLPACTFVEFYAICISFLYINYHFLTENLILTTFSSSFHYNPCLLKFILIFSLKKPIKSENSFVYRLFLKSLFYIEHSKFIQVLLVEEI